MKRRKEKKRGKVNINKYNNVKHFEDIFDTGGEKREGENHADLQTLAPSKRKQREDAIQQKNDVMSQNDTELAKISLQMLRVQAGLSVSYLNICSVKALL